MGRREQVTIGGPTDQDLQHGFASFITAAQKLEESYRALKARAAEIDVQLARANARLESTLQEREAVFRALPVGVIALARDGSRRIANPEAERLLASAAEHGEDLLGLGDGEHEAADLAIRVARVALPDGGCVVVIEDRSQVTRLEREVDRLDRIAGLSELALGVAHEIKNPLNGVMGFASLLERHDDPEQIKRCARKIAAGMKDVDAIVKSMLAFARPQDKQLVPRRIADVVGSAAAEANVPIARISTVGDLDVLVDGPTLVRVLANLLRNSTEAGATNVDIEVSVEQDDLSIVVSDDGRGVDSEVAAHAFEPFVSSKDRGQGLGLALVARVLSFLGGSIELVEDDTPGATFCIRTPLIAGVGAVHG